MKKELSVRELILLGILVIIAAYYFVVYIPVTEEMDEIDRSRATIETEITSLQTKLTKKRAMEKEVEKATEEAGGNPIPIPNFDNANNLITELHLILGSRNIPYNISFKKNNPESFVLRRDLDISFTAHSYEETVSILHELENSVNRYTIDDISLSDNTSYNENGNCTVSLNIFCYEYTGEENKE